MRHILDYIDSKDIREYNKDTHFTPIEQAFLIYYSRRTTIHQKMTAWQELLDTYTEEEFEDTRFGKVKFEEDRTNRNVVEDMITVYKETLALTAHPEGYVFRARYTGDPTEVFFPDYTSALKYLKKRKPDKDDDREFYDEYCGKWDNAAIRAEIRAIPYGKTDWYSNVFHLDWNLRLIHLWPNRDLFCSKYSTLRDLLIYVPTPFEEGDIVRVISETSHTYGVIRRIRDEDYYEELSKSPYLLLEANKVVMLDCFKDDDAHGYFVWRYCSVFDLEKCSADELPEEERILDYLSAVYQGVYTPGELLNDFSHFGGKAYK